MEWDDGKGPVGEVAREVRSASNSVKVISELILLQASLEGRRYGRARVPS